MGFAVFKKVPHSRDVRSFLGRAMHQAQATPKYLISDKGKQFWCQGFKDWCQRKGIRPRFGALGQHGIDCRGGTLHPDGEGRVHAKTPVVSLRAKTFRQELSWFRRLVQSTPAAYDVGRQDARRGLLPPAAGESKSSLRASCPLASACPLCLASGAGQGTARGADRVGGELPARSQASAPRHPPPRGVSRIFGQPSVGQQAAPLRRPSPQTHSPPLSTRDREILSSVQAVAWALAAPARARIWLTIRPPNFPGPAHSPPLSTRDRGILPNVRAVAWALAAPARARIWLTIRPPNFPHDAPGAPSHSCGTWACSATVNSLTPYIPRKRLPNTSVKTPSGSSFVAKRHTSRHLLRRSTSLRSMSSRNVVLTAIPMVFKPGHPAQPGKPSDTALL